MEDDLQREIDKFNNSDDEWIWEIDDDAIFYSDKSFLRLIDDDDDDDDDWIWEIDDIQVGSGGRKRDFDEMNNDEQIGGQDNVNEGASTSTNTGQNKTNNVSNYVIEKINEIKSKKFKTKGIDYRVRFSNENEELNIIQEYERTQEIFEQLINDITNGMKENDQVHFVLRTPQLSKPISLPFMQVSRFTPERIFSQVERVVQSNQHFNLNDTVIADIVHVEMPSGSGNFKRNHIKLYKHLEAKKSVVVIKNNDNLCLATTYNMYRSWVIGMC
ncbi:uncharacterized protein LOC114535965 [Dendronephthya gigantea]|uniref:uncharacterized protein LOC114535965 n=1 Tax=Dendronephthya gigantea TaxID=151771 RepID=UPI00106B2279|nr:uncharacterized protein LOC114535965 [Dendronephthya gigantea]